MMVRKRVLQLAPMIIMFGIICTWVVYSNILLLNKSFDDDGSTIYKYNSENGQSRIIYPIKNANITEFNGVRAIIQMDKEVYLPGETMNIRIVFVYAENGTLVPLRATRSISLKVVHPDKHEKTLHFIPRFLGILYAYNHICIIHIAN